MGRHFFFSCLACFFFLIPISLPAVFTPSGRWATTLIYSLRNYSNSGHLLVAEMSARTAGKCGWPTKKFNRVGLILRYFVVITAEPSGSVPRQSRRTSPLYYSMMPSISQRVIRRLHLLAQASATSSSSSSPFSLAPFVQAASWSISLLLPTQSLLLGPPVINIRAGARPWTPQGTCSASHIAVFPSLPPSLPLSPSTPLPCQKRPNSRLNVKRDLLAPWV